MSEAEYLEPALRDLASNAATNGSTASSIFFWSCGIKPVDNFLKLLNSSSVTTLSFILKGGNTSCDSKEVFSKLDPVTSFDTVA